MKHVGICHIRMRKVRKQHFSYLFLDGVGKYEKNGSVRPSCISPLIYPTTCTLLSPSFVRLHSARRLGLSQGRLDQHSGCLLDICTYMFICVYILFHILKPRAQRLTSHLRKVYKRQCCRAGHFFVSVRGSC